MSARSSGQRVDRQVARAREFRAVTIEALAAERPPLRLRHRRRRIVLDRARAPGHRFSTPLGDCCGPAGNCSSKDAENDGSWRTTKALEQERLMVHVLRRTARRAASASRRAKSSPAASRARGLVVNDIKSYAHGYTAPHVLLDAHVPEYGSRCMDHDSAVRNDGFDERLHVPQDLRHRRTGLVRGVTTARLRQRRLIASCRRNLGRVTSLR